MAIYVILFDQYSIESYLILIELEWNKYIIWNSNLEWTLMDGV